MKIKYNFKRSPMPHQIKEFIHHVTLKNSLTTSETGAGKTYPLLAATEFRFQQRLIRSCLYVAPNSILEKIVEEVKDGTELTSLILKGYNRKKRIKTISMKADIHIINYEALQFYLEFLLKNKYDQIIFDEAHNLIDYSSGTSKAAYALTKHTKFCLAATGTPLCSKPEDIFSIFKVLDSDIFGIRVGKFRDKFCLRETQSIYNHGHKTEFQKTIGFKPHSEREFRKLVDSISISYKKKDCLKLPKKVEEIRRVDLTSKLKSYYLKLKNGTLEDICDTTFAMDSGGVRCQRALQIASGFLYYKDNGIRLAKDLGESNKLKELKSLLSVRKNKKTVIWCKHSHVIDMLLNEFDSFQPEVQRSNHDNNLSRRIFQTDPNCKLIINQMSICDGYELTSSDCAIYFEMPYEHHILKQSQDRIHRKGSEIHEQILYYYLITRNTFDASILKALKHKKNLGDIAVGDLDAVLDGKY